MVTRLIGDEMWCQVGNCEAIAVAVVTNGAAMRRVCLSCRDELVGLFGWKIL